jgi:glucose-1-phosphate cytidylyltransferase
MKVVILAGGFGTRISEESHLKPKPMIEVGERPIIWHIMKQYSSYGFNDFIICLGYKGYCIKEYFAHYFLHESDVTFDFRNDNQSVTHHHSAEPWKVTLVNTGLDTMTGGRVKRVKPYLDNEPFMLTYGDGVSDINIRELVDYHKQHGRLATVTSVQPGGRFGALDLTEDHRVRGFQEKPKGDGHWINAGFFVMQPEVLDYIRDDQTILEREPLEQLAAKEQLLAYKHDGFWQPMDTLRDKNSLEDLWKSGKAPWKIWE